ncbi:hypothetical protein GQ44DRAFT_829279 [Phaeosphaeriaceae sp. PMI808]|nr:hypothetical protein GQ44DRAFT_829279 [Phaeosphaeriaceae sp. PMI808]
MSALSIAPPAHLQLQSPLVRLPAEIKHMIYALCFTAKDKTTDPTIADGRTQGNLVPSFGVALLQTCRRLYHEIDRRPFFSQNTFSFTTFEKAKAFFGPIDQHHRASVHNVEIDICKAELGWPDSTYGWGQYLHHPSGSGPKTKNSLHMDAPNLKTLRLNFAAWPKINKNRFDLWDLLKYLIGAV